MVKIVIRAEGKGWRKKARQMMREAAKKREERERDMQEQIQKHPEMKKYYEAIGSINKQLKSGNDST
jgi:hypothetical protein